MATKNEIIHAYHSTISNKNGWLTKPPKYEDYKLMGIAMHKIQMRLKTKREITVER
jgi:hypothetical protein